MLTRLTIRNFKRFADVSIELGSPVVFIGPNNSGKTTALQALALWDVGIRRWTEKRADRKAPEKRPGVTINRRDLIAVPVPDANLLWRDLHVRESQQVDGRPQTRNVRIDLIVDGVSDGTSWTCGLEFDFANEESFYCRPLRNGPVSDRMEVPKPASAVQIAFLPPMSGLAANETRLDPGAINVRLGEGRTAEVLRNLCYQIVQTDSSGRTAWKQLAARIEHQFRVRLDEPTYVKERGEVAMGYRDASGVRLDLSSAGRGLQQTLLLLAHLAVNPGAVLLLDEPDAHLEIIRQRQIYELLTEVAREQNSQIIAASHSEVLLNEAASRDMVVAFVGRPHRIDGRASQVLKSLKHIGFDQYYQAEEVGWVLYLEGSTDLAILRTFAATLGHPAQEALARPFVHYVLNQPKGARDHFFGLKEAKGDLIGFALFDRIDAPLQQGTALSERQWLRREIENYLCQPDVLVNWARETAGSQGPGPLFADEWAAAMNTSIAQVEQAMVTLGKGSPWSPDTKVSDEFLEPLFAAFYAARGLPNLMRKTDFHQLARHVPANEIAPEVRAVLDEITEIAAHAVPTVG